MPCIVNVNISTKFIVWVVTAEFFSIYLFISIYFVRNAIEQVNIIYNVELISDQEYSL